MYLFIFFYSTLLNSNLCQNNEKHEERNEIKRY